MGNLYRKASMDRLASPEQLDKMIRIASPSLWIALTGAGLVIAAVLIWAIFGSLPENVSVSGLYMSNTGVQGAYASFGGKVREVKVEKDQKVKAGDVVAVVVNETTDSSAEQLEERIAAVESVTLTSKNDTATSDNSQLLEYKLQYQNSGMTLEQRQESLKALQQQLEQAKQQTATYKASMDAAENAYLAAVGDDGANSANFNYQTAQEDYQMAQSEYQQAAAAVSQIESAYTSAESSLQGLEDQYASLSDQYNALKASYDSQMAELSGYQDQYEALADQYAGQEIPEEVAAQLASLENTIAALNNSAQSVAGQMASVNEGMSQAGAAIGAQDTQIASLSEQLSSAQTALSNAEARVNSAEAAYNAAQSTYGSYFSSQNRRSANQARLQTAFSEASSLYSNAYSQQKSIEQQIKEMSLETGFEEDNTAVSRDTLKEQFEASKEALLKDLKREKENLKTNGAVEEIKAPVSGTVVDCAVQAEQLVGQGTAVAKIKEDGSAEGESEIVRCYVPIGDGKRLEAGMEVVVTPSTVNEQEYGHMMATVESVGTFTVSSSEMLQVLGDETMVQAYQQQGPCVEVLISLEKDESTASGYAWSNKKGESVELAENTPITAKVRVKEDAPISKLIPFLKSKMDVNVESEEAN